MVLSSKDKDLLLLEVPSKGHTPPLLLPFPISPLCLCPAVCDPAFAHGLLFTKGASSSPTPSQVPELPKMLSLGPVPF